MCCLFGLVDVKHQLSGTEKNRIISILAEASEARGTDATGYACNSHGKLIIEKQPLPAHRMHFRIPKDAYIIMGHARLTTQGDAQKNRNNHSQTEHQQKILPDHCQVHTTRQHNQENPGIVIKVFA